MGLFRIEVFRGSVSRVEIVVWLEAVFLEGNSGRLERKVEVFSGE